MPPTTRNDLSDSAPPAGVPAQGTNELPAELVWKIVELRINDHEGGRAALLRDLSSLSRPAIWYNGPIRIQGPRNVQRFVDVVSNNPTLGSYVRILVYRLQGRDSPRAEIERVDPAPAFETMNALVALTIEVGGMKQDKFLFNRDEHTQRVLRLMQLETLESLRLRRLKIPVKNWALKKTFNTFEINESIFDIPDDWYFPEEYTKRQARNDLPPISARRMRIRDGDPDLVLFHNLADIRNLEKLTKRRRLPLDLPNVEILQIYSHKKSTSLVLPEVNNLKELNLFTPNRMCNDLSSTLSPSALFRFIPARFSTLTVLLYHIGITVDASQPLGDPYRGLLNHPDALGVAQYLSHCSWNGRPETPKA